MIRTLASHWRCRLLLLGAIVPIFPIGCGTTNTERGVTGGAATGAIVGALASRGHSPAGALIGGAAGALIGGVAGSAMDNSEKKAAARQAALRPPLKLEEIVSLTASGVSDDVIITQIRNSRSAYYLRATDLLYLQQNGVREPVVRYMQATAVAPVPVYAAPAVQPVYVVEPAPPVAVGVGIGFGR